MTLKITLPQARRFQLKAVRLEEPLPSVAAAIGHHGFIQLDPINVCGRMHDLILRNRVAGYREGDLLRHVYEVSEAAGRRAFEHYLPGQGIIVAFPLDAWPHLVPHIRERARRKQGYAGRLTATEEKLAVRVLDELAARGPLTSDDIAHEGRARSGWGGQGRAVRVLLQKLFVHGRVLISNRRQFRRVYDLPERVLPAAVLAAPIPDQQENQRWLIRQRLLQRRLVTLKRNEVPLVEDLVQRVEVNGGPPLYCLREDCELLAAVAEADSAANAPQLLAPLDPLIYDRKVTAQLWGFDYTWEVYTPEARRIRGYYALPVLAGLELVGHVDPKADRQAGKLKVVGRRVKRGHPTSPAVKALADFLGLRT